MRVILIRHGEALNHEIDELRTLSDKGKEQAKAAGTFLKSLGFKPDKIVHSELLRAKETALLLSQQLSFSPPLEEGQDLTPNSSTTPWSNNLYAYEGTLVLVGHMPYLGLLAGELTKSAVGFPTGGVLVLEGENGHYKTIEKNF